MDIAKAFDPRCPNCPEYKVHLHGLCWFCCKMKGLLPPPPEPSPEAKAMWASIKAVAERSKAGSYEFDQEGENFYDAVDQRIYRD